MRGWRRRIGSSAGRSLLAVLCVGQALAAASSRLEGEALAAAEAAARRAVEPYVDGTPTVDATQSFVVSENNEQIRVVPLRFAPKPPGPLANVDHCALAILAQGRATIVHTIGVGYSETVGCTGLDGIAFPDLDGDGRFDIELIYSTLAPPDRERKTPVVVRRSDGAFAVDDALSAALDAQGGITTLGELRRAAQGRLRKAR